MPAPSRPPAEPATPAGLVRRQVAIDIHTLATDGSWAAYVRRSVARNEYRRHLWRVDLDDGRPSPARQLTSGQFSDTAPAISPDGRWIAFLRAPADLGASQEERTAQPFLLPAGGGTPRRVGRFRHGVEALTWSPDSSVLGLVAPVNDERFVASRAQSGSEPTVRRITRLDYRDESGYLDHRRHLWLVDPHGRSRPRQLTRGDFDVTSPTWSPDGRSIVFATDAGPDAGLDPRLVLASVSVADGGIRRLAELRGDLLAPAFSPDGRWIAAIGTDLPDPPEATQRELFLVDPATGTARSLTGALDLPIGMLAWTHLTDSDQPEGPLWLDAGTIVVLITRRARSVPWAVRLDGSAEPMVTGPEARIVTEGLQVAAGRVTVNAQVNAQPAELFAVEGGGLRPLTRNGGAWRRRFPTPRLEEHWLPGPAGPVHAWLHSPADADDGPLPTVLDIHGGPTGSWGPGASLEVLAMTGRGWRVVQPNIRGSAGFGNAWVQGLGAAWGDVDAADALAVVDGVVAAGLADIDRLGVIGLSYGGFLTSWLVGVTNRFVAAVSENGVSNQVTAWAECHFGIYDTRRTGLGDPFSPDGLAKLWARSPLRNVAGIRTPLLMIQAEEDRVCPASDNVQLFSALKALGREVEYVIYPEEHHVFGAVGRPDRRIDRLERVLDWFARAFEASRAGSNAGAERGT
jgi:dipeptidyl aminopeptidase/acylaminoacyl peptidase